MKERTFKYIINIYRTRWDGCIDWSNPNRLIGQYKTWATDKETALNEMIGYCIFKFENRRFYVTANRLFKSDVDDIAKHKTLKVVPRKEDFENMDLYNY
tara:strand:+ start:1872 stop:2168 length:297 start_codon:yes stop_codon:yes gene_type:complete